MERILEIGSLNVNGSLKDFQPENSNWVGIDLEPGEGVDLVIEPGASLPFGDKTFDLVIAASVFEHDPMFWQTFNEMVRVTKENGFIYLSAPSNGWVHRYPIDVYRFYPDAGIALEKWGRLARSNVTLQESFVAEQDGDIWNDFTAVFGFGDKPKVKKIYTDTPAKNIWSDGVFLEDTFCEAVEDMRIITGLRKFNLEERSEGQFFSEAEYVTMKNRADSLETALDNIKNELDNREKEIELMQNSKSWFITSPLRTLNSLLRLLFLKVNLFKRK